MKNTFITLVGNVGSGKSTVAPIIAKAIGARILHADNIFQTVNPFRERYLKDMPRWVLANELWMTVERFNLLNTYLSKKSSRPTIIDSGNLMTWVYTYSHFLKKNIDKDQWNLYESIYNILMKSVSRKSHVLYMSYSIETLYKRIQNRGRDYEVKYYNKDFLRQLDNGLTALKKMLKKQNVNVYTISEKEIPDFEHSEKDRNKLIRQVTDIFC